MAAVTGVMWNRVRGALHHGVKRALAVVQSGFEYDMNTIADSFICEPGKTNGEIEAACLGLTEAAEEPGVDLPSSSKATCTFLLIRPMTFP